MPTYEYQCENCGHHFEKFQSITAGVLKKCPECRKMKLNRLIGTGAGIIFKGSGFYETDYRSESYKEGQKKDGPEKKSTDSKDSAKKEAKGSKDKTSGEAKKSEPAKKREPE